MNRWTIDAPYAHTFEPAGEPVTAVHVRTVSGLVDVVATDGPARFEVTRIDGRPLTVVHDPETGVLDVSYEDLTWGNLLSWRGLKRRSAAVSLAVPWDAAVELGVVNAGATVSGIHGSVAVRSVSGEITLTGLTGKVEAETVSGAVVADGLACDLDMTTVSGDLTLVAGLGGRVRANSVSGSMALDLDEAASGNVSLNTISGDLTVRLPHDGDMSVTAYCTTGRVNNGFGELRADSTPGRRRLSGTLGSGTGNLSVHTVSGAFTLLRRAPEGKVRV